MPAVSVIIPVYNGERFIAEAVDSVLGQTYRDFELIVVDDGSTDRTAEILKGYGSQLAYLYQPNRERSAARNTGVRHARGEYMAFLDADDVWLPHKLERQVAILDRVPEVGLVHSWAYLIDASGNRTGVDGQEFVGRFEAGTKVFEALLFDNVVASPTPVIRAECIRRLGDFDESLVYVEDWEMWLRISAHYPVAFIPEPLAEYRAYGDDWLQKWDRFDVADSSIRVVKKACRAVGRKKEIGPLRRRAVAYWRWQAARANYKLGYVRQARGHLLRALVGDRALWRDPGARAMLREVVLRMEPLNSMRKLRRHLLHRAGGGKPQKVVD